MKILIATLLALYVCIVWADEAPKPDELEMLKMTLCACECCEENKDTCLRPDKIPADYECDLAQCTEAFCEVWEKAKCKKDCFCKKCRKKLDKSDYRCMGFKDVAEDCKCPKKVECKPPKSPEEMEEKMKKLKEKAEQFKNGGGQSSQSPTDGKCNLPCFCKNCKKSLPKSLRDDCKKFGSPPSFCDCSLNKMKCPGADSEKGLNEYEKMRPIMEGKQAVMTGVAPQKRPGMTADEIKLRKCTMQCYCGSCGETSEKIGENCKKMVTKQDSECECTEKMTKCSEEKDGEGTKCKLYCLCNYCLDDPRMLSDLKTSCKSEQMKSMMPSEKCDCTPESCDILDKYAEVAKESKQRQEEIEKSDKAKQMKQGRMKKNKKKVWDEL